MATLFMAMATTKPSLPLPKFSPEPFYKQIPQSVQVQCKPSRRSIILSMLLASERMVSHTNWALADAGFKDYTDNLDGYSFSFPSGWVEVRGAGSDVFFRNPINLDENVVVGFSSPSSSRYKGIEDLGTPEEAAQRVLKQYLTEFMSTRLGVKRESNILSANSRIGLDGKLYYEIEINVKSFANRNQLAVMAEDRVPQLEWSRRYLSVLGVENNRLYELRLQVPERSLPQEEMDLRKIMSSFQVIKLAA